MSAARSSDLPMSDPSRTGTPLRESGPLNASNVIAVASLGLAGLTVLLTYLNVRRQADAAMQIDHVRWLREKRDDLYAQLIDVLLPSTWEEESEPLQARLAELDRLMLKATRYASDPVFKDVRVLEKELKLYGGELDNPTPTVETAIVGLIASIRSELVGPEDAKKKAWRRH